MFDFKPSKYVKASAREQQTLGASPPSLAGKSGTTSGDVSASVFNRLDELDDETAMQKLRKVKRELTVQPVDGLVAKENCEKPLDSVPRLSFDFDEASHSGAPVRRVAAAPKIVKAKKRRRFIRSTPPEQKNNKRLAASDEAPSRASSQLATRAAPRATAAAAAVWDSPSPSKAVQLPRRDSLGGSAKPVTATYGRRRSLRYSSGSGSSSSVRTYSRKAPPTSADVLARTQAVLQRSSQGSSAAPTPTDSSNNNSQPRRVRRRSSTLDSASESFLQQKQQFFSQLDDESMSEEDGAHSFWVVVSDSTGTDNESEKAVAAPLQPPAAPAIDAALGDAHPHLRKEFDEYSALMSSMNLDAMTFEEFVSEHYLEGAVVG